MKQKLIKLSETHYIVTSDDAILKDDWCIELHNGESKSSSSPYSDKNGNKWWLRKMNMNCGSNDPKCKKIIHSTIPLSKVKLILLSEVEEVINGYNVEKMAMDRFPISMEQFGKEKLDGNGYFRSIWIEGFKAHQELVKDKLFTVDDMEAAFEAGEAATIHRIVQGRSDYITFDKFIQSLLPKTEWDIEFVNGKIKLTNDGQI